MEYGFSSELDAFLNQRLAENALATKEWLNWVFIKHFSDIAVATGILRTIAHLEYGTISPAGPTIALAALSHSNVEVRESGIRAFEHWGTFECLKILENVVCQEEWLKKYLAQVVYDLRKQFRTNVTAR